MTAFRLNRFFSQPEILRSIDPENLMSLLADHESELVDLGLTLPEVSTDPDGRSDCDFDYQKLMMLLMEPDQLPEDLREAFYFVHEMATDEGLELLLEAAAEKSLEIVGKPAPTSADAAVQVWLKDRELLERKHAEQFLRNPRSFQSFCSPLTSVPQYADPIPQIEQMEHVLDDFFEKRKRGRNTKIFPYVREDSVWFLVRHGDPFKREGAIDKNSESVGVYYWPERFDVLVLDPKDGELRINARNKGEKKEYRKVFGTHLYGDENFFSVENRYTLEPLRTIGEDALAPVDGMDEAVLTEIHFAWGGSLHETEIRKADDVFAAYAGRSAAFPNRPKIAKARFRITFSDSETSRSVTIKPPNEAQYTRDADSVIVESWLKARKFIVNKEQPKRAKAAEQVLVNA